MKNNLKSDRKNDSKLEVIMQKFFNLIYRINDISFERCTDTYKQRNGTDLIIHNNGKEVVVDEKCATKYFDRPLNTFSFELSANYCDRYTGIAKDERYDGWFVNEKNVSDMYAIGYVRAISIEEFQNGHIQSLECLFVPKNVLKQYILEIIQKEDIRDLERIFKEKIETGEVVRNERTNRYTWQVAPDIRVVMSDNLAECPINIIVGKSILSKVSVLHGVLTYHDKNTFTYKNLK